MARDHNSDRLRPRVPVDVQNRCDSSPLLSLPVSTRRRRQATTYSITWSARKRSDGGMVRPRALAVLRLMTRSNFVDCCTGRSAGFIPLKILSTYTAAPRYKSMKFGEYDINPPAAAYSG